MNLSGIKNLVTSKAARPLLHLQKHSPKILFVAGTVGIVGTVVLACRATLKTVEIMDDHEKRQTDIHNGVDTGLETDEAQTKELGKLKVETAIKIVQAYAPAVGLGLLSVGALSGSHIILSKRNGTLMAAYAGLDRAYRQYRNSVAEEYGEDVDKRLAAGGQIVDVEEKLADGTTKVTKSGSIVAEKSGSPYRFLFDPVNSRKWSSEPGRNAMLLQIQQSYLNDKLRANGHLFLNEVLDALGIPRTKIGAVVGWVYRHDNEEKTGDNYVDFGVFRNDLERGEAFINGDEPSIWLDFNVDGVILDLIEQSR